MLTRVENSVSYTQGWDQENRLQTVTVNGATTTFTYDGDGKLVKKTVGITTTYYVGPHYEKLVSTNVVTATKYYFFGSQRVGMRVCTGANGSCGTNGATSTLTYLHGDHLGSASLSTNASGGKVSEMRYYPYGEMRSGAMATDRQYTGQRREIGLGLYDYNARYYDPYPNRFIQADSIVPGAASGSGGGAATLGYDSNTRLTPLTVNLGEFAAQVNAENREVLQFGAFFQWDSKTRQEHNVPMGPANPQALNRYAYCLNNPLRYVDPTGHQVFNILDSVWKAGIALLELKITNINRNLWKWELGAAIVFGAAGGSLGLLCGPGAYVCAAGIGALSAGAGFLVGRSLGEATVAEELDVAIKYIAWAAIPEADSYEVDFQWVHTSPLSINPSLRIEVKGLKPIYISRKAGLELLKNLWISADEVETASE